MFLFNETLIINYFTSYYLKISVDLTRNNKSEFTYIPYLSKIFTENIR